MLTESEVTPWLSQFVGQIVTKLNTKEPGPKFDHFASESAAINLQAPSSDHSCWELAPLFDVIWREFIDLLKHEKSWLVFVYSFYYQIPLEPAVISLSFLVTDWH